MKPIIIVPARLASTRLPGKPLADIHGRSMICHVLDRAREAGLGPVLCAAAEPEIVDTVEAAGFDAVLTDPDHPSGSDRIWEALTKKDPDGAFDVVVNLQGDLPTLDPQLVRAVAGPLDDVEVDIATLVAEITDPEERDNPNVVKCIAALDQAHERARALYFTRATAPSGGGPLWHHIGIYAYRRDALARFVAMPPGMLEQRERLEQLRALEAGMRIDAVRVDTVPLGVDTPADLERAREFLER
ncbi:MAG: 3-deoxy-manno-octulosonate cytidylyltransferase [Rhodospirillales bacterium]|nr:3-deoxy-manno-octulosonate cytidylyltransferase [Rhodospirillales bacterium]MBO6787904.1 3-deoxy-manno-octulosonate cytidylyltransferase [Rhodospirillales bacterium]